MPIPRITQLEALMTLLGDAPRKFDVSSRGNDNDRVEVTIEVGLWTAWVAASRLAARKLP